MDAGIDSFVLFGFRLHWIHVTEEKRLRKRWAAKPGEGREGKLGEGRQRRGKKDGSR